MIRSTRSTVVAALALALTGLAGCATDASPVPLTQAQLDAFGTTVELGSTTVGEAAALAPAGLVGLIEVHVEAGGAAVERASYGTPPAERHDWLVIGYCGAPDAVPSVEVAAVAPSQVEALDRAQGFDLVCDLPPSGTAEG